MDLEMNLKIEYFDKCSKPFCSHLEEYSWFTVQMFVT